MTLPDTIEGSVRALEKDLGLSGGFLERLRDEDDWSFIIKAHALIEAAVSHLVCTALDKPALAEVFSYLELSDKRRGKMAFASALDLVSKSDRRFISSLSELRNTLVHDIQKVGFSLSEYVAAMDSSALASFAKNFDSFSTGGPVAFEGSSVSPEEVFRHSPKTAIWWSTMLTVAILYQVKETEHFCKEEQVLRAGHDRLIVERLRSLINPREKKGTGMFS